MKPTNSPTQGQPNPRNNRLKVAIGPLFFQAASSFSWVGIGLYWKQTTRNPRHPTELSAFTLLFTGDHSNQDLRST